MKIKIDKDDWIILILDSGERRKCGRIDFKRSCYIREVIPEIHFYIMGQGYPISNLILKHLKLIGIQKIRLIEKGKRGIKKYETTVKEYVKGVLIQHKDFEQQRIIPLSNLKVEHS